MPRSIDDLGFHPRRTQQSEAGNSVTISGQTLSDFAKGGLSRIVFVIYKNLDVLLDSDEGRRMTAFNHQAEKASMPYGTQAPKAKSHTQTIINSDIIGLLLSKEPSLPSFNALSAPIMITFRHLRTENVSNPQCVYWDSDRQDWQGEGCFLVETNLTHTQCSCSQLANYALLMDITEDQVSIIPLNLILATHLT